MERAGVSINNIILVRLNEHLPKFKEIMFYGSTVPGV